MLCTSVCSHSVLCSGVCSRMVLCSDVWSNITRLSGVALSGLHVCCITMCAPMLCHVVMLRYTVPCSASMLWLVASSYRLYVSLFQIFMCAA